jgi:hypothetical protein
MGTQPGDQLNPSTSCPDVGLDSNPDPYYPCPPNAEIEFPRTQLSDWEKYQYSLAWRAYRNNWHAPFVQIQFAMHTYSNVEAAKAKGDPTGSNEPSMRLYDPTAGWYGAERGIQTLDDLLNMVYAASDFGSGQAQAPIVVSEWNTITGPNVWPADNYPQGLLQNAIAYVNSHTNVMGFASFVDTDPFNGCTAGGQWLKSAITGYLDTTGCVTGDPAVAGTEKYNLAQWDSDFGAVLQSGW